MIRDTPGRRGLVQTTEVLHGDAELAEAVPSERRVAAAHASRAHVLSLNSGTWDPRTDAECVRGGHGLLIMSGILVGRVGMMGVVSGELVGPGDLLRPLEHDGSEATLPFESAWRVLETTRLAILDGRWSRRMCEFPEVGTLLTGRAVRRSRRLADILVIASHPRLDERLWLLLWELADRYGTVHPDGVRLQLPLTHQLLAELAAARRPSVSTALRRLSEERRVERRDRAWILHGKPPARQAWSEPASG